MSIDPTMGIDPRSVVPGAMREYVSRDTRVGLLEFEEAPAGWLTQRGEPRRAQWRAYHLTAPAVDCVFCGAVGRLFDKSEKGRKCGGCDGTGRVSKRERMTSVTTFLDAITAKGGLVPWAEKVAVRDTLAAVAAGHITPKSDPVVALDTMRHHDLGVNAEKGKAATRGLNVHALLEEYMRTGSAPSPGDHPEPHRGYIRALSGWLARFDPEPVLIEHIVACPEHGYAGRLDLVARAGGTVGLFDLKSQENAGIYAGAHVQAALYRRALRDTDDMDVASAHVVALAADGSFRVMDCLASDAHVEAACAWYRLLSPIDAACNSQNQAEKDARRAAAA